MLDLTKKDIKKFQAKILQWYEKNKRDLPWRNTQDPYHILVAEIMAQQTQVSRVVAKYQTWLQLFPTIQEVANAKREDILRLWSGLGYNRRALYLQKCAIELVRRKERWPGDGRASGYWPKTIRELEMLPSIGPYTARAIACFAFGQQVAVVDANVRKVILFHFKRGTVSDKNLQQIADMLLPVGKAYEWNQALMDYASLALQKEKVETTKQSAFQNSNRYYRGKLLRLLIQKKELEIVQIGYLLRDTFTQKDQIWCDNLLRSLQKDELIRIEGNKVRL